MCPGNVNLVFTHTETKLVSYSLFLMPLKDAPLVPLRATELLLVREGAIVVKVAKETDKESKLKNTKMLYKLAIATMM